MAAAFLLDPLDPVSVGAEWAQDIEFWSVVDDVETADDLPALYSAAALRLARRLAGQDALQAADVIDLSTDAGLSLAADRVLIRAGGEDTADWTPGVYDFELRLTRQADGGVESAVVGRVTIGLLAGALAAGDRSEGPPPFVAAGSAVRIYRDAGVVRVVRGSGGPMGLRGEPGVSFDHVQASAAAEWVVNHNLGFRPIVSVRNAGGFEVTAEVEHMSDSQVRIRFAAPLAGAARCN